MDLMLPKSEMITFDYQIVFDWTSFKKKQANKED